ncbi:hypothetical protein ACOZ38_31015 [Sphaerisporangium viridialbum]|uniref:hypothetical protein n=1 Tax=Sphaerisporangium viridialbum TaxID=46189 RepID=UPI003C729EE6
MIATRARLRTSLAALTIAAAGAGLVASAPSANAQSTASTASASTSAAASSSQAKAAKWCGPWRHTVGTVTQTVYVTNKNCRGGISFQVREAYGPDSPCIVARYGHTRSWKWSRHKTFQGIRWNCA